MVRVHMRVPGTQPMPQLVRLIQSIEAAGFDGAGILDSQLLSRDTFVVLPSLAIPAAVHEIYPDLSHAHDWEAAIRATSFVPDDVVAQLCDAVGLIGAPADCATRIADMAKLGLQSLYLMPTLTFAPPEPEIAAFREVVFPRLRDAGVR